MEVFLVQPSSEQGWLQGLLDERRLSSSPRSWSRVRATQQGWEGIGGDATSLLVVLTRCSE